MPKLSACCRTGLCSGHPRRNAESRMLRFLDTRFEELLGSLLLAVMVSIAFINVIVRYCTSFSFAWTEELTVNFFVWVVLRARRALSGKGATWHEPAL